MPMPISGMPLARCSSFMPRTALAISIADLTARWACSGVSTGAPQNAITQSPMYLSIVPRLARMMPVSRVKTSLSRACSWIGSMCSDILVKPRMSQNITVISRFVASML
jgi:hypothetical protein